MRCTSGLLVNEPYSLGLFHPEYTQLHPQNKDVFVTASFRGDKKPSVLGSWLILAIPASSLGTIRKTFYMYEELQIHFDTIWSEIRTYTTFYNSPLRCSTFE